MSTAKPAKRRTRKSGTSIRRKNLNIDQDKLDRVVELLAAKSETEAIDRLLDEALLRQELVEGIRAIAGTGGMENYFDEAWE